VDRVPVYFDCDNLLFETPILVTYVVPDDDVIVVPVRHGSP
jgi:hypothetical protein